MLSLVIKLSLGSVHKIVCTSEIQLEFFSGAWEASGVTKESQNNVQILGRYIQSQGAVTV